MAVLFQCLALICIASKMSGLQHLNQLRGSQVPRPERSGHYAREDTTLVDLRVGQASTTCLGTPSGVKRLDEGDSTAKHFSWAKKRALRRARRRAEEHGGTFYRGRWHTSTMLGVTSASEQPTARLARPRQALKGPVKMTPRLRVFSYNIGGMAMDAWDVFVDWLKHCDYDIVVVQELHWGMGKEDHAWTVNGWAVFMTADEKARHSGVGIFISPGLRRHADISHCTWVPGRLLHVRCECRELTLDVLGIYQWVQPSARNAPEVEKRSMLWDKLGRLLQGIPKRNLLVIGADLNSVVEPTPGHVGRGVLQQRERGADRELAGLLAVHQLVPLNTWGRARAQAAYTFSNGSTRTQIDFLLTRKVARTSGPTDLDLVPWRHGPKHRPVVGSLPWRAGWALHRTVKPPPQLKYSLQAMREAFRVNDPIIRQKLEPKIRFILDQPHPPPDLSSLNQQLQQACSEVFPASAPTALSRPSPQQPGAEVQAAIRALWNSHRDLRHRRGRITVANVWAAWRSYVAFRTQHRLLRQASRRSRRMRLQYYIDSS